MILPVDLTEVAPKVRQEMHRIFTDQNAVALMQARLRQARAAKFYRENTPRPKEGFGPLNLVVDPYIRNYWELKLNRRCWQDPEFVDWIKKRDEAVAVKEIGSRPQVGARGLNLPARERTKRFSKTYP